MDGFLEKGGIQSDGEMKQEHKGGINWQGDVDVKLVSVLYCHSSLSLATETRTYNKGVGSKDKGKWPVIPLITRRLWPL